MSNDKSLELAEVPLNYARMAVRDLVQRAYEAGQTSRDDVPVRDEVPKPTAKEVNDAITAVERGAVQLAHARMEHVAKACGFEGLTEALGYLITLRDNPLAELLREGVTLAEMEPSTYPRDEGNEPSTSAFEAKVNGWCTRVRAVVGATAPPPAGTEAIELLANLKAQTVVRIPGEADAELVGRIEAAKIGVGRVMGVHPALGAPYAPEESYGWILPDGTVTLDPMFTPSPDILTGPMRARRIRYVEMDAPKVETYEELTARTVQLASEVETCPVNELHKLPAAEFEASNVNALRNYIFALPRFHAEHVGPLHERVYVPAETVEEVSRNVEQLRLVGHRVEVLSLDELPAVEGGAITPN